jgi:dephospho-CoA kinase
MIIVGLTGSIAMGKSEVGKILQADGIPLFDADKEVHRLYDSAEGAALIGAIAPEAVNSGTVDRQRLSALVLADTDLLARLEKAVHAEIRRRRQAFIEEQRLAGQSIVVLDVPLLFETGGEKDVDVTIVVSAGADLQRRRALARPGMTEEKLAMILARQMPDAEKRKRAHHVIETNGTLEELAVRTRAAVRQIRKEHAL